MSDFRLDALVHYICARCETPSQLGATKLNKVLWYSDVFTFAQEGESITGATYVKRQFGPVPKDILASRTRLESQGLVIERKVINHSYPQSQFIALQTPNISMFSAMQISIVDSVLEAVCLNHTAASISQRSHDFIWESAEIGEEIPLAAAAFGANFAEIDEDDVAWAKEQVAILEGAQETT